MQTGELIKFLRKQEGLSQKELAVVLGVKLSSIQKYESGAVSNLKMETIKKLCEVFRIPPWLLIFPEKICDENAITKFQFSKNMTDEGDIALKLNEEGIRKVLEYARDLVDSGNYKP